jgi:wyosine [tRNA(Phe)-imidazoG37] synthetase (radical SAM superfamily)
MIRQVKALRDIPVAVITNGSLLWRPEVREDLMAADAVLPSLDAGTAPLYRAINRPHPDCTFQRLVEGLISFRAEYPGRLWVEVMLVKGLNDTEEALHNLSTVLSRIAPDEVHVSSPVRPPAESWVEAPDSGAVSRAASILGETARPVQPITGEFDLAGFDDIVDAIVAVISRHPMAEEELMRTLRRWTPGEIGMALGRLMDSEQVQVVSRYGQRFWSCSKARYERPAP